MILKNEKQGAREEGEGSETGHDASEVGSNKGYEGSENGYEGSDERPERADDADIAEEKAALERKLSQTSNVAGRGKYISTAVQNKKKVGDLEVLYYIICQLLYCF